MAKRPRATRERAICSTRIRYAMAQQLQVECNVGSTDSLVLGAVRCCHKTSLSVSLQIGDAAPDFTLPDQNGDSISLASLRGKKVVLYFYPKDDTPGCTKEACNFRDRWEQLKANNITVLGISKDGATSHNKFINKHELPFTLLTDEEPCAVASLYESYGLKKFMGREYMGMMRHTFLIDEEGKLERIYLKVKAATMADTLISDLGLS